jgi:hypothetical protein
MSCLSGCAVNGAEAAVRHLYRGTLVSPALEMKYDDIGGPHMSTITYKVVKHDGGWAYEANGTYSEPFATRDLARKAAKVAASEQAAPGETTQISYEDEKGHWHNEVDSGTDRPKTTVEG